MKPAIEQMIAWIEGELAYYPTSAQSTMDKGYRVLEQSRKQALKIKERCDADAATKCEFISNAWHESIHNPLS